MPELYAAHSVRLNCKSTYDALTRYLFPYVHRLRRTTRGEKLRRTYAVLFVWFRVGIRTLPKPPRTELRTLTRRESQRLKVDAYALRGTLRHAPLRQRQE